MAVTADRIDTATVLFTDLVGSTALRSRIGEEAADALRVKHDRLVGDAIAGARGIVVKHTGDGMMATFPAAVDAVAAGIAIQQAVDGHNRRSAEERFEVRVGISVGDVTFTADDCFGLPVIEAQRLEAAADGGQILCAEIVRHLARGRGGYQFDSVGDLDLKGIPDPVPAVAVHWEPVVQVSMPRETPLPSVLAGPRGFDLAGRQAELDALLDAWKESADGRRKVVLLSGEPGIGKTRLATEAALVARHQGGLVLAGRCDEELELPFQPFAEALRFQADIDEAPTQWFGPLAAELVRLVPELTEHVPGLAPSASGDPDAERARLFDAVTGWLRTTSASIPVLLVLDDLHWADRTTLLLLRHVIHETAHDALCIVGTYRSTDLDRTHPLATMLADLRRDGATARLALDGLSADGVAELLERASGHDLEPAGVELAHALFAETGGNPFFVGEIVRHLVESGALVMRDGRWTSDFSLQSVGLPEGVREVVGRRISHLDGDTQRLLSVAAVIGHEFTLPVLAAVTGVDEDRALDLLDNVRSTALVDEVGLDRYRFGHALVRATLLDELTTTRLVRTHRKIAEMIEAQNAGDLDAVVTELAYHYGEAAAAEPGKAIEYATPGRATRSYATAAADDAVRWYTLALEHVDAEGGDAADRAELLTELGRAEWNSFTSAGAARAHLTEAARLAQSAGLDEAMANALLVGVRSSFNEEQESDPEKIELLEDLLERLGDAPVRARLLATLAVELIFVGDRTRRGRLLDEARQLAEQSGDPLALIEVTANTFNARPRSAWSTDLAIRDRAMHKEALTASEALDDVLYQPSLLIIACFSAITVNDGAAIREHAAQMADLSDKLGGPPMRAMLLADQMIATIEGRLVEAEALFIEQFAVWRKVSPLEALTYRATEQLAVRREQGRLGEIVDGWSAFVADNPRAASSSATVAFAVAESGELDAAATRLDDAWRGGLSDMPDDAGWPLAVAGWAEVAALAGHHDAARELHGLLRPWDGLAVGTGGVVLGPAARLLAGLEIVLDRVQEAHAHFAAAIDQSEALGSPVWVARCCFDWAETLIARDKQRARDLVEQGDAAIGSLQLPRLQQQSAGLRARLDS